MAKVKEQPKATPPQGATVAAVAGKAAGKKAYKFHTIEIPADPNRDPALGPEYVPINVLGSVPMMETCEDCKGEGCAKCGQTGKVPVMTICETCDGEGKRRIAGGKGRFCTNCGGKGEVPEMEPIEYHDQIKRGEPVDNVPDYALEVLKNAIEKHYRFVKSADEKSMIRKMGTRKAYPFSVLESYDIPKEVFEEVEA